MCAGHVSEKDLLLNKIKNKLQISFTRPFHRQRVVLLSFSPRCVKRKKTLRENGRVKSERRLLSKRKSLNYALLSQRKNIIGLC